MTIGEQHVDLQVASPDAVRLADDAVVLVDLEGATPAIQGGRREAEVLPAEAIPGDVDTARRGAPRWDRARTVMVLAVVLVAAVALTASCVIFGRHALRPARVTVSGGTSPIITVADGSSSLRGVAEGLPPTDRSLLRFDADGSADLGARIVIAGGGHLTITATTVRLLSGTTAGLVVDSNGSLIVKRSSILSWNGQGPQTVSAGRRPAISANGPGARLLFVNSLLAYLGTSLTDPGVAWSNGAAGGATDSQFDADFSGLGVLSGASVALVGDTETGAATNGALLQGATRSVIRDCSFNDNARDGIIVAGSSHILLTDVEASGNAVNGIDIEGTKSTTISLPELDNNKLNGLFATGSIVTVRTPHVWSNATGLSLVDTFATITNGYSSDNVVTGVLVSGVGRTDVQSIRLDHNVYGLNVLSGAVRAVNADFDQNATGLSVTSVLPDVTVTDSTFTGSTKDAIALTALTGLHLRGNVISGSATAAVSTASTQNIDGILAANTVEPGQPRTRVRGS